VSASSGSNIRTHAASSAHEVVDAAMASVNSTELAEGASALTEQFTQTTNLLFKKISKLTKLCANLSMRRRELRSALDFKKMRLRHKVLIKKLKKVRMILMMMTSCIRTVKEVMVILFISICILVSGTEFTILVDAKENDPVVDALDTKYSKICGNLDRRLSRNYGSAYIHYLQWIAVTEVENAVRFKYAMPRNVPGRLNGHIVDAGNILDWFNIKAATYKGIRTSMQRGQKVLNVLQDRKARGQAWLNEDDGPLVDQLEAFFCKRVIPDPQRHADELSQAEAQACMLTTTRYNSIVNSFAKQYNIPRR
jgi:phage FluMu protein gp41